MTSVSTYLEGTIIVDIIDHEKNQLVWRGVAHQRSVEEEFLRREDQPGDDPGAVHFPCEMTRFPTR